jgi:hypothetical protein
MTNVLLHNANRVSAILAFSLLLSAGVQSAHAGDKKTAAPAPKAAAPAKPAAAPAAHGTAGAAGTHGSTAGAAGHGTSTGPSANHPAVTTANHGATSTAARTATPNTVSKSPIKSTATAPKGSTDHTTKDGSAVRTRADGKVSDVHDAKRGMDVHHGLDGSRRVSVERKDGSRLVSEHGRRSYVQRSYSYHGHDYATRSYYYQGREYNRYYRGYYYGGVYVNVYAPAYYYGPGFYGWAYNPWAAPIAFGWGWAGNPWYGYYGFYFNPYPVYPSAAFWLTDYIVSQDLQAAYAARQEAAIAAGEAAAAGGPPALTPEVKQQIADEVKAQLALENAEAQQSAQKQDVDPASSGIARLLSDGHPHVFVVGGGLDLVASTGQECAVSEGDALQLVTPPPAGATAADLVVLASKGGKECAKSSTVSVNVADLQEMQNHMRETIDQGLQDLQAKQGKGGLPAAPPSAQAKPAQSEYAAIAPPPNPQDAADLKAADQQANQAETEVTADAGVAGASPIGAVDSSANAPAAAPVSVNVGQTIDEVKASLGTPTRIANLGTKVIYYYNGMKVTFKAGKVSDVE